MNKDIIIEIFQDSYLSRLIFNHVQLIHKNIYNNSQLKKKYDRFNPTWDRYIYRWKEIKDDPTLLAKFNMLKSIKQYYTNNNINADTIVKTAFSVIEQSLISGNIQILKYMLWELIGKKNVKDYLEKFGSDLILIALSQKSTTLEIIRFLDINYMIYINKIDEERYFEYYKQSPKTGNLEIVKWFDKQTESLKKRKTYHPVLEDMFRRAVSSGSADIFKWLLKKKRSFDFDNLWEPAIKSGSVDLLNCMISNEQLSRFFNRETLFDIGFKYGRTQVIEWLYKHKCTIPRRSRYFDFDDKDSPDFIDWFFHFFKSIKMKDVIPFNNSIDWYCYYSKQRYIMERKRLTENPRGLEDILVCYQKMKSTLDYVLYIGNTNIFKWLHANQVDEQCSPYILTQAHYINDIEFVQWLFDNRTERCTGIFEEFFETYDINLKEFIVTHYPKLLPPNVLECNNGYVQLSYEMFNHIVKTYPQYIGLKSLATACHYGDIDLVQFIHNKLFKDYPSHDSSNRSKLEYRLRVGSDADIKAAQHQALKDAFYYSNLSVIEFLFKDAVIPIESHLNYKDYLMDLAIHIGNLELIRYLHNNTVCKLNPAGSKMILKRKLSEDDISSMKALRKKRASHEPTLKKYKYN